MKIQEKTEEILNQFRKYYKNGTLWSILNDSNVLKFVTKNKWIEVNDTWGN